MSVTTKTLTFTLEPSFKGSCKLVLAFVPAGQDTFKTVHPVAWKVFELNQGGSQTVVWNDYLGGCRATVDSDDLVTVEEIIHVPVGYSTDLLLDNTQPKKPIYSFTTPTPFGGPGNTRSRVGNMTGTTIDHFGTGFITTDNKGRETMDAVLLSSEVKDGGSVFIDYVPQLKVWTNLNYKQSELLDSKVANIKAAWEADLSQLNDKRIQIMISRLPNGQIVGETVSTGKSSLYAMSSLGKKNTMGPYYEVNYTANITFALPGLVAGGLQAIIDNLSSKDYPATRSTVKGYDTEASLTLTLAPYGSCSQAEQDLTLAITYAPPSIYGKAFIKSHSGAVCLRLLGECHQSWMEINPASPQWFGIAYPNEGAAFDAVADAAAFASANNADAGGTGRKAIDVKGAGDEGDSSGDAGDLDNAANGSGGAQAVRRAVAAA